MKLSAEASTTLLQIRDQHKNAATFPASHFLQNREFNALPAHAAAYKEYVNFKRDHDWADQETKYKDVNDCIRIGEDAMAMETLIIFFENPGGTHNEYDISVFAQDALNFPAGGMLHSLQRAPQRL